MDRGNARPGTESGRLSCEYKAPVQCLFWDRSRLAAEDLKVETVVLTGVMTEICILCSAFEAFNRDYRVVVVKDCTAGRDPETEACVLQRIIALEVGWVLTSEEVIQSFGKPNPMNS